jgi:hypothetical protein
MDVLVMGNFVLEKKSVAADGGESAARGATRAK